MLETGLDFGICTFRFGEHPSDDEINTIARHQALCPQVPFEVIEVPRSLSQAHDIATWCIENSGSVLKTAIEVRRADAGRSSSGVIAPRLPHACSMACPAACSGASAGRR